MALGDPYATLADLKAQLGITDTGSDAQLTRALNAVSRSIEQYCGRQFNDAGAASARVFYADSVDLVEVDDFSTTTGLVVAVDYSDVGSYSTTWTSSDYQLLPLNGVVSGMTGWPYTTIVPARYRWLPAQLVRRPSVQVTAQWGWAAVPAPVADACLLMAGEFFKLKDAPFGVANYDQWGPIRVRQNPLATGLLDPYRRTAVLVA